MGRGPGSPESFIREGDGEGSREPREHHKMGGEWGGVQGKYPVAMIAKSVFFVIATQEAGETVGVGLKGRHQCSREMAQ